MTERSTGKKHFSFFREALRQAARAVQQNEVPIGAVLVRDGKIVSKGFNQTETRGRFTAHAEMICIEKAAKKLKSKYLNKCDLYITLEPCRMCRTAAQLSRIQNIFYLVKSPKFGSRGKAYFKTSLRKLSSTLTPSAVNLLRDFFEKKR